MKKIIIEVRDDMPMGRAIQGSIKLTGDQQGIFTEHKRTARISENHVWKPLIHGRICIGQKHIGLHLDIDRAEQLIDDETWTQVMEYDCNEALAFMEQQQERGGALYEKNIYESVNRVFQPQY